MRDYVYHDRKMMKWMPFNALLEQGDYINDLLKGRERQTMPTLSPDQQDELNYQLETAYLFRYEIDVAYFEDHQIKHKIGVITRTDLHNKLIFVNDQAISAYQITNIDIL
jgi:hypothetical protein